MMTDKQTKAMNAIAGGTYATSIMDNYSRNINGGVIGGIVGCAYAWRTRSSLLGYGIFGFVAGAAIAGIIFKPKTVL